MVVLLCFYHLTERRTGILATFANELFHHVMKTPTKGVFLHGGFFI